MSTSLSLYGAKSLCQLLFHQLQKASLFSFVLTLKLNLFEVKRAFLQIFVKMSHWENDKLTKWLCSYIITSNFFSSTAKKLFCFLLCWLLSLFYFMSKLHFYIFWQNATLGKWQVDKMMWRRREGKLWNVKK